MAEYDYDELLNRAQNEVKDPEKTQKSRFEIPKADVYKEGNVTIINNLLTIAKKFNRDPDHLIKFLADKLGTSGKKKDEKASFKGSFSQNYINNRIKEYTETYLFCYECKSPDTRFVKVDDVKMLKCDACGARKSLQSVTK
ncbi:translation initiation factor IF-2 subunit beta [Methanonatronarchaeum sp. AMET6-2]|uniref:translation initiation factor IF-2 subunit beta n=1 Tax=Methanonatronarchaeum sp. AMET6-2 TaxID=2933293 RepID=UPI00121328C6|nr:translation initiation factor IF-2 subunit beta [Methanonatronarchaeum sp. AMET6-2]RZN63057.1 MAG: translation initiation factor IF-2 subunit beta [Methanonatronarchaeia archaeon]UOY09609.1 translation initiation factor IF-2 subunit beta [Methanonatronarchaeum sp. AMET6-2]